MVSKMKLLEPRFLVNVCDRWNKNKTDNLQAAWFNGVGYETWENVWGTWNGITPRDALRGHWHVRKEEGWFAAEVEGQIPGARFERFFEDVEQERKQDQERTQEKQQGKKERRKQRPPRT